MATVSIISLAFINIKALSITCCAILVCWVQIISFWTKTLVAAKVILTNMATITIINLAFIYIVTLAIIF